MNKNDEFLKIFPKSWSKITFKVQKLFKLNSPIKDLLEFKANSGL